MKMKSAIASTTLFFITGVAYTQDRVLSSFDAAKAELSRLLECRDWMKAGSSKEVGFDSLPIAKLRPRKLSGVVVRENEVEAGGYEINYVFPSPVIVYGFPVNGMRLAIVEGTAEQTVLLNTSLASLLSQKVQPELGVKLTLTSTNNYSIEKDGRFIIVGKDLLTKQSSLTCGVGILTPEQVNGRSEVSINRSRSKLNK